MEKIEILEKLRLILEVIVVLVFLIVILRQAYKIYTAKCILKENERLQKTVRFLNYIGQENTGSSSVTGLEDVSLDDLKNFKCNLIFFYKRKFLGENVNIKSLGKYLFFVENDISEQEKKEVIIDAIKNAILKSRPELVVQFLVENIKLKATSSSYDGFDKKSKFFILNSLFESKQKFSFLKLLKEKTDNAISENSFTDSQKVIFNSELLMIKNFLK